MWRCCEGHQVEQLEGQQRFAVGVVAATLTITCGIALGGGAGPAGSATTTPTTPTGATVLTTANNVRTITVAPGSYIFVVLSSRSLRWTEPTGSSRAVVRSTGGTLPDGTSQAVFDAAQLGTSQLGTSQLDAVGAPTCVAGGTCPQYVVLWHVTIDVLPVPALVPAT